MSSISLADLKIFTCDMFLRGQKGSLENNILKEVMKRSGLATEHLRQAMLSLVNAGTI